MGDHPSKRDGPTADSCQGRGEFDFATEFEASYRVLTIIAAGVSAQPSAAEDIVHEAAVQALGKLNQFKPGTDFTAWMAQIVRYVALNHSRTEYRRRALRSEMLNGASRQTFVQSNIMQLQLTERGELPADQEAFDDELIEALQSLSHVARACLLLRTIEGLSYSEIASIL